MGHDPGQLRLLVGIQNQAGVDVEESAGQRQGVDLVRIDDLDGERNLAIGVLDDVLADAVDVFHDHRIGDELGALLDLRGVHLAHLDLGVGRVPVAHAAPADIAIAHCVHVVDAPRLYVDLLAAGLDHLVGVHGTRSVACYRDRARRRLFRGSGGGRVAPNRSRTGRRLCGGRACWRRAGRIGLCPHSGGQRQNRQHRRFG